jgi:outer membrane protein assembly factor BamB
VTNAKFSTDWSTRPRELWRRKIGPAWSSFAAVGDYLFTQEQRGEEELVTCYRAGTGEDVWTNRVQARFEDMMGLGPRATPSFDQGKLYVQGATGVLQCLDASTGNTVWKRDIAADTDTKTPMYGFASSPLVLGELVIGISSGGEGKSLVAYNRASGDVAWLAGHGGSGYSSPQVALLAETPQVLMVSDFGLQSFTPETGAPLWEHPWKVNTNPRCIQPLVVDSDSILLGTTGVLGSRLLRIQKEDASWNVSEEWTTKNFRPYFNDCVLHKGYCYGFDGDRIVCIDVKSAERRWRGNRCGGQLVLISDMDMLLILTEAGDVVLIPATPERFSETARFKALSGKTWNHPVVAHGKLFVRNSEEAACFELPATVPES